MTVWVILYWVGAVQAAMLAAALWRSRTNAHANRVLSGWLGIIALDLAVKAGYMGSAASVLADAYRIARLLPLLYAPMFFVYVRVLTAGQPPRWRDLGHAAWFGLALAWAGVRWLDGAPLSPDGSWDAAWFDPLLYLVAFAYLAAALRSVGLYRRRLKTHRSDADRLSLRWLTAMAAGQFLIWGIALLQWLVDLPYLDYYLIYAAVAAWVCVIGWFSLSQPPVTTTGEIDPLPDPPPIASPGGDGLAGDARVEDVEARLSELMSCERLYREPALTIAQLARRSGYPEYLVSAVINRRLGGNFWEYVNRHRIEAVRTCLSDPDESRTILEIAYDAGFTSKSTFNTAFKRLVGETPSAYRRRHAGQASAPSGPPRAGDATGPASPHTRPD
ncbi:helix-turn-helix domain-containing protein [Luteimonas kalidii]|uniref:AraC family transcriptional regulator n=1 Tax=Luteimonas kalidii TaxID=3042025 RepID=A0ABT6JUC8_9GAMM|nr:AraC family transcriptional regulator [Luteimonas kalidii]MDH5834295.1 AraC family transcriptional regulator [Luteimonas kalidii]